jgi:hypothetical protein
MSLFVGSVYGKVELDKTNFEKNSKSVGTSIKGLTASMVGAQAIFAVATKALSGLVNVGKQAVKAFIEQERVEKQLNAVLKSTQNAAGLTAKEIKNMASSLQQSTTFGDEAILNGQNLLLTFTKIGKDVFPAATETMLNMSQAMGQDLKTSAFQLGKALNDPEKGVAALTRVGVQFTEEQKNMIDEMVKAGDVAGAQKVILAELETQFGGSAKAARDTFGGALKALQNTQGDLLEVGGSLVATFGRDIVEGMNNAANGVLNFVRSAAGQEKIAEFMERVGIAFSVLEDIVTMAVDGWMKSAKEWFEGFKKILKDNISPIEDTGQAFKVAAVFAMGLNLAFEIMMKTSLALIRLLVNMAKIWWNLGRTIWEAAKIVVAFFKGEDIDVEPLKKAVKDTGDAFADMIDDVIEDAKGIASTFTEGVQNIKDSYDDLAKEMQKKAEENGKKMREMTKSSLGGTTEDMETENQKQEQSEKSKWQKFVEFGKQASDKMKAIIDKISQTFGAALSAISTTFQGITNVINMFDNEALKQMEHRHAKELIAIQNHWDDQKNILSDKHENEMEELDNLFETKAISEEEYNERKKNLTDLHNKDAEAQKKAHDDAIFEQEKKAKQKENDMKKKMFENNKAFSIAEVWINAGLATMAGWASAMSIPFPGNVIVGAAISAATLALAIAQTVGISQQQFVPALAKGGMVGNSRQVRVNEEGGEIITLPDGSQVVPHDISRQIANSVAGSKGGTEIHVSFAGANIDSNMSLDRITNHVIRKLGRELRLT